jgi:hypothetical protein
MQYRTRINYNFTVKTCATCDTFPEPIVITKEILTMALARMKHSRIA